MQKQILQILDTFLAFSLSFEEHKIHNMLSLILTRI
jgi:hypothetical protein